jgi:DNA-binding LacI/PurR family transcriptional regulator
MANIKDVAKRAGVSVTTASFVLSGRAAEFRISASAAEKVMKAANALDYRPNYHARTFKRGRSDVLGFPIVLQDPNQYRVGFWQGMLTGVDLRAREDKCDVLLIGGDTSELSTLRAFNSVRNSQVDALIVPGVMEQFLIDQPGYENMPVVLLSGREARSHHPCVILDPEPGLLAAIDHLKELGHTSVQYVTAHHPEHTPQRPILLSKFASDAGLSFDVANIWSEDLESETVVSRYIDWCRENYAEQLDASSAPTAVICSNDLSAIGVQAALREAGLSVPQDVSLIGFDNIYAHAACPQMTVISHMLEEMGEEACELALSMVGKPKVFKALRDHEAKIPAELIIGKSTAVVRC